MKLQAKATLTTHDLTVDDHVRLKHDLRHGVITKGRIGIVKEIRTGIFDRTVVVEFPYVRLDGTFGLWAAAFTWVNHLELVKG